MSPLTEASGATVGNASAAAYPPEQARGTGEYDYAARTRLLGRRLVYSPDNGQRSARDQAFAKGGSRWGSNQRKG
jgi:hypothetical protein